MVHSKNRFQLDFETGLHLNFSMHIKLLAFSSLILLAHGLSAHTEARHALPVWEQASHDPDRIFLSFSGDPATSRAVTWRTSPDITQAVAQITPATADPMFSNSAVEIPANSELVNLNAHPRNSQGTVNYHSVVFTNLIPDTLYAYRVGTEGHWSEWIQFRTAKTVPAPFSFVYFGDAQNDILSKWSRVIRMSYQKAPDAAFAIHAGDLVNNGHFDNEWAEWFKAGGWIHAQRTGIPVIGNHEIRPFPALDNEKTLSVIWRPQFTLPEESELPDALRETVYTVDYQGVRIIVLNSLVEVEAQADYLRRQLQRPGAKWTILTSHYSIFSPRPKRDYPSSRLWLPIIEEFGVDLVLQGHDHVYARGHQPARTSTGDFGEAFQTLFVTSVSGKKQYKVDHEVMNSYNDKGYNSNVTAEQKQFFQVIDVDGDSLTYTAYTADGAVFDKATISKDPETGVKSLK
jgi:hypothetical protein